MGRFKNSLESIGFDLVAIGVIEASVRAIKFLRAGDEAGVAGALKDLEPGVAQMDAEGALWTSPTLTLADDIAEASEGIRAGDDTALADIARPTGERAIADVEIEAAASKLAQDVPPVRGADDAIEPIRSEPAAVRLRPADQSYTPTVRIEEAEVGTIIDAARAEAAAIKRFGSREAALQAGADMPKATLPWKAISATEDVETLVSTTARSIQARRATPPGCGSCWSVPTLANMQPPAAD